MSGYWIQRLEPQGVMTSDREAARAWLYGDLVHATTHSETIDGLGMQERMLAAVGLLDELVMLTTATLALIEEERDADLIELPEEPFKAPVVIGLTKVVGDGMMITAPPGTPAPLDLAPLSSGVVPEGWTVFGGGLPRAGDDSIVESPMRDSR